MKDQRVWKKGSTDIEYQVGRNQARQWGENRRKKKLLSLVPGQVLGCYKLAWIYSSLFELSIPLAKDFSFVFVFLTEHRKKIFFIFNPDIRKFVLTFPPESQPTRQTCDRELDAMTSFQATPQANHLLVNSGVNRWSFGQFSEVTKSDPFHTRSVSRSFSSGEEVGRMVVIKMIGCMKKEHVTWLSFSKRGLHNLFVKRM